MTTENAQAPTAVVGFDFTELVERTVPEPHVYRYSSGIAPTRDAAWPLY